MVFISTAMVNSEARRSITNPIIQTSDGRSIEYKNRNEAGEPMSKGYFPDEAWVAADANERQHRQLPNLFFGGGFWFVSPKATEVLRQYDLGKGALYPAKVFGKDRQTPLGENGWNCLNFGNRKSAFLADKSTRVRPQVGGRWPTFATLKDDEFAVSAEALAGPDIWVDPLLWDSIFFSDRLGKTLKKATAANGFYLRSCRVIS